MLVSPRTQATQSGATSSETTTPLPLSDLADKIIPYTHLSTSGMANIPLNGRFKINISPTSYIEGKFENGMPKSGSKIKDIKGDEWEIISCRTISGPSPYFEIKRTRDDAIYRGGLNHTLLRSGHGEMHFSDGRMFRGYFENNITMRGTLQRQEPNGSVAKIEFIEMENGNGKAGVKAKYIVDYMKYPIDGEDALEATVIKEISGNYSGERNCFRTGDEITVTFRDLDCTITAVGPFSGDLTKPFNLEARTTLQLTVKGKDILQLSRVMWRENQLTGLSRVEDDFKENVSPECLIDVPLLFDRKIGIFSKVSLLGSMEQGVILFQRADEGFSSADEFYHAMNQLQSVRTFSFAAEYCLLMRACFRSPRITEAYDSALNILKDKGQLNRELMETFYRQYSVSSDSSLEVPDIQYLLGFVAQFSTHLELNKALAHYIKAAELGSYKSLFRLSALYNLLSKSTFFNETRRQELKKIAFVCFQRGIAIMPKVSGINEEIERISTTLLDLIKNQTILEVIESLSRTYKSLIENGIVKVEDKLTCAFTLDEFTDESIVIAVRDHLTGRLFVYNTVSFMQHCRVGRTSTAAREGLSIEYNRIPFIAETRSIGYLFIGIETYPLAFPDLGILPVPFPMSTIQA